MEMRTGRSCHKLDMMGNKDFVESRVKKYKGILSKEVAEKDKITGFRSKFMGRIGMQLELC